MFIGVLYGLIAGALWGLIYVAPLFVPEYHPVMVALGRFFVFGLISLPFLWMWRKQLKDFSRANIWRAFTLSFFGNVIFYSALTVSIRLAGAPLAGMLMATIPVLVALVSNWQYRKEGRALAWGVIMPPLVAIFAGLMIANITEFEHFTEMASDPVSYWIGVGFGLFAISAWTWFSIGNSEYLLEHPHQSASMWTALQGVTNLPTSALAFFVCGWGFGWVDTAQGLLGPHPMRFLGVIFMIGLLCSWVAMIFWNGMSQRLPAGLGGQLIVFESIFAVVYALIWRSEWPTPTMVIGFSIVLAGVFGSLYIFRQAELTVEKGKRSPEVTQRAKEKMKAEAVEEQKQNPTAPLGGKRLAPLPEAANVRLEAVNRKNQA